ncbi:MAG: hypothetical protein OXD34_14305 [bacterium]|nr:hypothetical protein [bacterium]
MTIGGIYRTAIRQDRSHVIHPFSRPGAAEITPDDMYMGGTGCYMEAARGNGRTLERVESDLRAEEMLR